MRIAIVGAGISGMAAGYFLSREHEVWLYERETRLGGHTHTHAIETSAGVLPIDTGFIVHNDRTYPNLVRLFAELKIERQKSDMSFGVRCERTGMEYSSRGVRGFLASRSNWFRIAHYKLFAEIVRFNKEATAFLRQPAVAELTLRKFLRERGFAGELARLYLYPMASAVWSTSLDEIEQFPALTLLRFFDNHGFLTINGHPQWYVVKGGSSAYIAPLTKPYKERIVLGAEIESVTRGRDGALLHFADGGMKRFDAVVFACHGPQALALLGDATATEQSVLRGFQTTRNETVLHTDARWLPRSVHARAAWNYHLGRDRSSPTLTYSMNRLQGLPVKEDYCVTLNAGDGIDATKVLKSMTYFHPLYSLEAVRAQARWSEISGWSHTHFCGAYWFNGFHEDGLNSALRVARSMGIEWVPGTASDSGFELRHLKSGELQDAVR